MIQKKKGQRVLISSREIAAEQPTAEVQMDATLSENHVSEATVTEHATEQGGKISDHIIAKPRRLTLTGVVSNTPLKTGYADPSNNSAEVAYRQLLKWQQEGTLLFIRTRLDQYKNMALPSVTVTRDVGTGNVLALVITAQEVFVTSRQTAKTERKARPKQRRAEDKDTAQKSSTTQVEDSELSSNLRDGVDNLRSFFGGK